MNAPTAIQLAKMDRQGAARGWRSRLSTDLSHVVRQFDRENMWTPVDCLTAQWGEDDPHRSAGGQSLYLRPGAQFDEQFHPKLRGVGQVLAALMFADLLEVAAETAVLARISHRIECIGAANQRKSLCSNNLSPTHGAPRCRQSVAQISLNLHPWKDAK
jgi:hypothetical protein